MSRSSSSMLVNLGSSLQLSYKDHVINEEACEKIQQAIGPHGPPNHRKEMHMEVVWTCPLFIRSDQNHNARYSDRNKKTRQTVEET